jgi:septum formation protein
LKKREKDNAMKKSNCLYLASSSRSRQVLLQEALIPFEVVGHMADEEAADRALPFKELLLVIARSKIDCANLPADVVEGREIYVLAADSMGYDAQGIVHGKPKDRQDAIAKLTSLGDNATTATAYCIDKRIGKNGQWVLVERIERVIEARYRFVVPEAWIDRYLEHSWAMIASGAIAVEFYGAQFLEWVDGSYSAVMGLPMFELRQDLEHLGFFD